MLYLCLKIKINKSIFSNWLFFFIICVARHMIENESVFKVNKIIKELSIYSEFNLLFSFEKFDWVNSSELLLMN